MAVLLFQGLVLRGCRHSHPAHGSQRPAKRFKGLFGRIDERTASAFFTPLAGTCRGFGPLWLAQKRLKRGNWPQSTTRGRAGANFRELALTSAPPQAAPSTTGCSSTQN